MRKKVDLDKNLEYKGYWYLPSCPENAIAGVVTYLPNEKIVLELFGGFDNSISELFAEAKEESIIYGNTSDAKKITLIRCYQYSSLNFNAQFPIVRYNCNYMIVGKHIGGMDEKCNYWANAIIPELTLWCHPAAIEMTLWHKEGEEQVSKTSLSFSTIYQDKANIIQETHVDDNTSISLIKAVCFDGSTYSLNPQLEQYTYLELQKQDATSINDILSDIYV